MILSNNERLCRILLMDVHGEYTGGLGEKIWEGDSDSMGWRATHFRGSVIWDASEMQEIHEELSLRGDKDPCNANVLLERIMPGLPEDWGMFEGYGNIWLLEGNEAGMRAGFERMLRVMDTELSGDDDTFDYWPNTMEMVWEWAKDLDGLYGNGELDFQGMAFMVYESVKGRTVKPGSGWCETEEDFNTDVWSPPGVKGRGQAGQAGQGAR